MNSEDLQKLNAAANLLVNQETVSNTISRLSEEVRHSRGPFVWSVIDLSAFGGELPEGIKSCWVFVLKGGVPSGCHYHPNSVQHMVVVRGEGVSRVGGTTRRMARLG